jgi:rfaE bifunctional protein kinase chain/domain
MNSYVLVTGRFNVLHPGHVRLFQFARGCGERLVVAVESDNLAGSLAHIRQDLRLEGVQNCMLVDDSFVFDEPIDNLIRRLQPSVVVKGREYERKFNPEVEPLSGYGGKLIFSSGEVQFSSTELLRREFLAESRTDFLPPHAFMTRHGFSLDQLRDCVKKFSQLRVLVIGDFIIDDYINCEPLGMSHEDHTVVVSPIERRRFIGGAGIVAAHTASLGAATNFITVVGTDDAASYAAQEFNRLHVNAYLLKDASRPTTVKERYRSHGQTLLRVSHLHQSAVSINLQNQIIEQIRVLLEDIDLLIFSDFNYGVLPQSVVDTAITLAKASGVMVAADSQSSSQLGDIARFKGVDLLTPTEREARVSTQNREDGLVILAEQLRQRSDSKHLLLKMGEDGVLIHASSDVADGWQTDQVVALNKYPIDVAGAGDSMLVGSALTLAAGGSIWQAACIGSMAAAVQVSRVGNIPIRLEEIFPTI